MTFKNENIKVRELKNKMSGHRERIRDKFKAYGLNSFSEKELLELLLTFTLPRVDTNEIAKKLLEKFNNIETILAVEKEEDFEDIKGLGKNSLIFFNIIRELSSRLYIDFLVKNDVLTIKSKSAMLQFLRQKLSFVNIEEFYIAYIDSANHLIKFEKTFSGTLDKSAVYVREIVKNCLLNNAKAIILVHNHPSGETKPSNSDIQTTKLIKQALSYVEVIVYDHIIISKSSYFSFAENKII